MNEWNRINDFAIFGIFSHSEFFSSQNCFLFSFNNDLIVKSTTNDKKHVLNTFIVSNVFSHKKHDNICLHKGKYQATVTPFTSIHSYIGKYQAARWPCIS